MDLKNNYISITEDIKQIAQDLLQESETQKVVQIRYFKDKADNEPSVLYRRFESVSQMQQLGLVKILSESENYQPRNLFKLDTNLVNYPVYRVKINLEKIEIYLARQDIPITTRRAPDYNGTTRKLAFLRKSITIRGNDQRMICEIVLKNEKSMRHKWQWDEIFEKAGETDFTKKDMWRKIYNAGRKMNERIAAKTGIGDLFLTSKQTFQVNPRYLPKN